MSDWITFESIPENAIGFTYIIINELTGQSYIGMKTLKGRWEKYYSSCKSLQADVKEYGEENFTRGIIRYFYDPITMEAHEINLQMKFDVLKATFVNGDRMFYNRIIQGVGFNVTGTPQPKSPETRQKLRESHIGVLKGNIPWNKGKKAPQISAALKGKPAPNKGKTTSLKGTPSPIKGTKWTEEQKAKLKTRPIHGNGGPKKGTPSPKKGRPSGRKGMPSPLKGRPSGRKGQPNITLSNTLQRLKLEKSISDIDT